MIIYKLLVFSVFIMYYRNKTESKTKSKTESKTESKTDPNVNKDSTIKSDQNGDEMHPDNIVSIWLI